MGGLWSNAANAINGRDAQLQAELARQQSGKKFSPAPANPDYPGGQGIPLTSAPLARPTQLGASAYVKPQPPGPLTQFGQYLGSKAYDLTPNFMRPDYSQGR